MMGLLAEEAKKERRSEDRKGNLCKAGKAGRSKGNE